MNNHKYFDNLSKILKEKENHHRELVKHKTILDWDKWDYIDERQITYLREILRKSKKGLNTFGSVQDFIDCSNRIAQLETEKQRSECDFNNWTIQSILESKMILLNDTLLPLQKDFCTEQYKLCYLPLALKPYKKPIAAVLAQIEFLYGDINYLSQETTDNAFILHWGISDHYKFEKFQIRVLKNSGFFFFVAITPDDAEHILNDTLADIGNVRINQLARNDRGEILFSFINPDHKSLVESLKVNQLKQVADGHNLCFKGKKKAEIQEQLFYFWVRNNYRFEKVEKLVKCRI